MSSLSSRTVTTPHHTTINHNHNHQYQHQHQHQQQPHTIGNLCDLGPHLPRKVMEDGSRICPRLEEDYLRLGAADDGAKLETMTISLG